MPTLDGAHVFLAELMRKLPITTLVGPIGVPSYRRGCGPAGTPTVTTWIGGDVSLHPHPVVVVDGIVDTGGTFRRVRGEIAGHRPLSVETVVLFRKPGQAFPDVVVDCEEFDIEDAFVVGCGLNYTGRYGNLPPLAALRTEFGSAGRKRGSETTP